MSLANLNGQYDTDFIALSLSVAEAVSTQRKIEHSRKTTTVNEMETKEFIAKRTENILVLGFLFLCVCDVGIRPKALFMLGRCLTAKSRLPFLHPDLL